jgi:hypothetical protein
MHMWHHVTNPLIVSNDKDSNSENRIKLRVRDNTQEDPSKETDKGKSSHVSFAESPVTLQGIADRNETIKDQTVLPTILKYPRALDESAKKKATFE